MTFFAKELADLICHAIAEGSEDRLGAVNWWCDNCDALLNEQPGFSDSHRTWKCRNCGHVNRIDEDQIIDVD